MANKKGEVLKAIDQTVGLLEKLRDSLIREFSYLELLSDNLFKQVEVNLSAITDPKLHKSWERSFFRKCKKIVRKVSRSEIAVDRADKEVINSLDKLSSLLPYYLKEIEKFLRKINVHSANLLSYASRKDGEIILEIKNSHRTIDALHEKVHDARNNGLEPFLAAVNEAKKFFEDKHPTIEERLDEELNFTLDIDKAVGRRMQRTVVLLDADVLRKIEEMRLNQKKEGYRILLSALRIIIPLKVFKELERRSGLSGSSLIPRRFRNYLLGPFHAKILKVKPSRTEKERIFEAWKHTPKGSLSEGDLKRFEQSGDFSILAFVLREKKWPTTIFSNDNDVSKTVKDLKKRGLLGETAVYAFRSGTFQLTA